MEHEYKDTLETVPFYPTPLSIVHKRLMLEDAGHMQTKSRRPAEEGYSKEGEPEKKITLPFLFQWHFFEVRNLTSSPLSLQSPGPYGCLSNKYPSVSPASVFWKSLRQL